MEEADDFAGVWINSSNVRSFEAIAMNAGKGEVIGCCLPTMLSSNDVIDLEWRGVQRRGQSTIFTA
jgi:hypothetical protein